MYRLVDNATNDYNMNRSLSLDNESTSSDEHCVQKRKTRRVRSLVRSSTIEKDVNNRQSKQINNSTHIRHSSTSTIGDKRPFPFGQCRVCMDKATGAHYGVPTCEGCKGFFKRSILRKEKYRCYFGDGCIITTDNRNRCKSCRFQKCLKEGMSVEGVRMGRIPKVVKEKALAEHHLSSSSTENEDPSLSNLSSPSLNSNSNQLIPADIDLELIDEQLFLDEFDSLPFDKSSTILPTSTNYFTTDENLFPVNPSNYEEQFSKNVIERIEKLIGKISHPITEATLAHEDSLFIRYLRRKMFDLYNTFNGSIKQFIQRMITIIKLEVKVFPGDNSSIQDILTGLADAIPFHVKNLITFAREMPAINEIDLEDFHKIVNNRLFDYWLIKHAPLLYDNESYIMLPNNLQYTRQWMNKIIGEETVETIFEFAKKFNALKLTSEEYALIFPVVICTKDQTLKDQETVRHIQYCYLYALYNQMLTTRTQLEAKTVFRNLLQIFTYLPLLNELQQKKVCSIFPENMESEL